MNIIYRAYRLFLFSPRPAPQYHWTYESYPMTLAPLDRV